MNKNLNLMKNELLHNVVLCEDSLYVSVGGCLLGIRSNSNALLLKLRHYFRHAVASLNRADIEIIAIDSEILKLPYEFIDWQRVPGKSERKDAYYEVDHGRLVLKVRTGMVFLQSNLYRIAIGPCLLNDNQVINFINAQYMTWLQHKKWLICHAAGLVFKRQALAVAGFSGSGKSTLMLHFLEHEEFSYLTNDRLFIREQNGVVQATGIPKLPRVNPGTLVHNPRLSAILNRQSRDKFLSMPEQQLWHLEEKYDVDIETHYGKGRIAEDAVLTGLLILNWQRDGSIQTAVKETDLNERQDLLAAVMKSPGPFFQYPNGRFFSDQDSLNKQTYIDVLASTPVYEVSGKIDFSRLVSICREQFVTKSDCYG